MSKSKSTTLSAQHDEDEEDAVLWEPLEIAANQMTITDPHESMACSATNNPPTPTPTQTNTWQQRQSTYPARESQMSSTTSTNHLEATDRPSTPPPPLPPREHHRHHLQTYLVDHPMQLFWTRFAIHFARELWELDLHLRFAIILITCGYTINCFLSSYYYSYLFWSPRWILLSILLVGPWIYFVERKTFHRQLESLKESFTSPEHVIRILATVEPSTIRTICLWILFVPTLFEVKNLVFLSHIKAEVGWSLYNAMIAISIFVLQCILRRNMRLSPKECSQKAIIFLYGSALLVSLVRTDFRRLPWLAGPFFVSTGVLLWTGHEQDILAHVLRRALRRTVQDVVQHVGTSVHQNEMLQLALLRWLTDYWTTTNDNNTETNDNVSSGTSAPPATPAPNSQATQPTARHQQTQPDLNWQDVFPMLTATTNLLAVEVEHLQQNHPQSSMPEYQHKSTHGPSSTGHPAGSSQPRTNSADQPPQNSESNPFQDLKGMLLNWDIDDNAKPAVQSIQRGVAAFPPGRKFAIFFSVARRCPAFLAMLYQIAFGKQFCWTALLILLALISFEVLRLHEWILSCHVATIIHSNGGDDLLDQSTFDHADVLQNLDPMVILLSDDIHTQEHPSSLLRVWWNLGESVSALQKGLTAARCVQSTAVAADFVENVMSLAKFGMEVQKYGWTHGLMVAVRDIFVFHVPDANVGPTQGYSHAAYGAFYNSQRLYKNASALSEEGELGSVLLPLIGLVPVLLGHGWLWAQGQPPSRPIRESTVTIEEIIEEEDEGNGSNTSSSKQGESKTDSAPLEVASSPTTRRDSPAGGPGSDLYQESETESDPILGEGKRELMWAALGNQHDLNQSVEVDCSRRLCTGLNDRAVIDTNLDTKLPVDDRLTEKRSHLMELIAKCQVGGILDETDKNRICEDLANFGSNINVDWLKGTIRTLEGLLEEHESSIITPSAPLESSTGDLFSVSLRSKEEGSHVDLATSDEWEGLGTNSSKASLDSLAAVETQSKGSLDSLVPVEAHESEEEEQPATTSQQIVSKKERSNDSETPIILASMAAIGAAAIGAFVASRRSSQADRSEGRREDRTGDNNDTDWVQVEPRKEE